jgi:hypothetical protein
MIGNFMDEMTKSKSVAPSKESLLEKIMGLEEALSRCEKRDLDMNQERILYICTGYIHSAREE